MTNRLENVFSQAAVAGWSETIQQAWRARITSPDAYLRALPAPGQRLATGPWTTSEEAAFEGRLAEFQQQGWPLAYWGIFSLALPHRNGAQCRTFYRNSRLFRPTEEQYPPLAAVSSCLAHHKLELHTMWTSAVAEQVAAKVDSWLSSSSASENLVQALAINVGSSVKCSGSKGLGGPLQQQDGRVSVSPAVPAAAAAAQQPMQQQQQRQSVKRKQPLQGTPSLPQQQQLQQQSGGSKPANAPTAPKWGPPAAKKEKPVPAAAAANVRVFVKKAASSSDDDDDADDFVAGSLRNRPTATLPALSSEEKQQQKQLSTVAATSSKTSNGTTARAPAARRGKVNPGAKKRRLGRVHKHAAFDAASGATTVTAEALLAAADPLDGSERLTIVRLDKTRTLPGWARPVLPYCPPLPPIAAETTADGAVVLTQSILDHDFSALPSAGGITGVIINAPLQDSAASAKKREPSADGVASEESSGVTAEQLAGLRLGECLASDAIVCVWARKRQVGSVIKAMAEFWGCKYVENLTWAQLEPSGAVFAAPSPLFQASHMTLVMGRRGGGGNAEKCGSGDKSGSSGGGGDGGGKSLELRHQRSADVVMAPALGGGRFPDAVREALETLLPPPLENRQQGEGSNGGTASAVSGGPPRLLEVAFHGAEPGVRPGWVKLVQAG